jgi:hypothetical protein
MKLASVILVLIVAAFVTFSLEQGRSLRRASLINGANQLRVAQAAYEKHGYITNSPTSRFRVWLSTNIVTIADTQHHCFAEVSGGWGWDGGKLAMTTNQTLVWLDASKPPKIITLNHRPPIFGGPY